MLPRRLRLSRSEFQHANFSRGALFHSDYFSSRLVSAPRRAIGVIVSKKVARTAVERHTIRRRVYASLRPLISQLPQQHALIVTVKKSASSALLRDALGRAVAGLVSKLK